MIYKLDHIAFVISKNEARNDSKLHDCMFSEIGLKNPEGKNRFLKNAGNNDANLYFISGNPNIEYIAYDEIEEENPLCYKNGFFEGSYTEKIAAKLELEALGFVVSIKEDEGLLMAKCRGFLDKMPFELKLKKTDNVSDIYLDCKGWNCPCFLVDSVKKMIDKMKADFYQISGLDSVTVNGKEMDMLFLKPNHINIIFEFISIRREMQ